MCWMASSPSSRPTSTTAPAMSCWHASSARTERPSRSPPCPTTSGRRPWPARTARSGTTTGSTSRASCVRRSANLEAGQIVQGASTITQQVIDYARVLKEEGVNQVDPSASPEASVGEIDPDAPVTEEDPAEEETDVCQPPEPKNSTAIEDKIRENILAMQVTAAYPGREGKEQHPRDVSQSHLLREWLVRHQGRRRELLRAPGPRADDDRAGRLPRRSAAGAVIPRPLPEPDVRPGHRGGGGRCAP